MSLAQYNNTDNFQNVFKTVTNSEQMSVLTELHSGGQIPVLRRFEAERPLSLHKSTKIMLKSRNYPVIVEYAHNVDYKKLWSTVLAWIYENMTGPVYDDQNLYFKTKMNYHLSYYEPKLPIEQMLHYGINNGQWDTISEKEFRKQVAFYLEPWQWVNNDLRSLDPGIDTWDELTEKEPLFKILRHGATSGYPHYMKQNPKYWVSDVSRTDKRKRYYKCISQPGNKMITFYTRLHGAGIPDEVALGKVIPDVIIPKKKNRFIAGDEEDDKVDGLPLTGSFKKSLPPYCPYFKDWITIFQLILNKYMAHLGDYVFTTDQSRFDGHHHKPLVIGTLDQMIEKMVADKANHTAFHTKRVQQQYINPKIIMNAFYYVRLNKVISLSGVPATPAFETLNNAAAHRGVISLDFPELDILFEQIQIDDLLMILSRIMDLKKFSKQIYKRFGFEVNPDKTEDNVTREFIVFLQVLVGKLFQVANEFVTLGGEKMKIQDVYAFLGHIMRRMHRLLYKERLFQTLGGIEIEYQDDDTDEWLSMPVHIARFLGTIASIGPMIPIELLTLILSFFYEAKYKDPEDNELKPFWPEVVDYCKRKVRTTLGEFGFDPRLLIVFIADNY